MVSADYDSDYNRREESAFKKVLFLRDYILTELEKKYNKEREQMRLTDETMKLNEKENKIAAYSRNYPN